MYKGEGDNWSSQYVIDVITNIDKDGETIMNDKFELIIHYKGELQDLSDMTELEYFIETADGSASSKIEFLHPIDKKTFHISGSTLSTNGNKESDVPNVTIKWYEYIETIDLNLN